MTAPTTYKATLVEDCYPEDRDACVGPELTYLGIFDRLAQMIADGRFPFRAEDTDPEDLPRVGDGVLQLDVDGVMVAIPLAEVDSARLAPVLEGHTRRMR